MAEKSLDCAGEEQEEAGRLTYLMVAQELVREAENLGWHHCKPGTYGAMLYQKLVEVANGKRL